MFGKLLTLATTPLRIAAAPVKVLDDAMRGEAPTETVRDTARYILTGKQDASDNVTDGFGDFDEE